MAKLEDRIREMRVELGDNAVPESFGGVTKAHIRAVLSRIDRATDDIVDTVFALLDDRPSWYGRPTKGMNFAAGATTAHIGCHVGILQRNIGKADRELVRDYWIKPLRELGAVEAVTWDSQQQRFLAGHPVAKSGVSGYRMADEFVAILKAPTGKWESMLKDWAQTDRVRHRAEFQAQLAAEARASVDTGHSDLIGQVVKHYAPKFLPGYEVVYIDDGDGDRVTKEQAAVLRDAGLNIQLSDSMPDVLLWCRDDDSLWVVEAVTSDGEVDITKLEGVRRFAKRSGKTDVGCTTAYPSWKVCAQRQGRHKNLAPGTYIWISEDPSKHFLAQSYEID